MGLFGPSKPKAQEASSKITGGRINQVKCPWCGFPNDFRGVDASMLVDKGSEFDCDKCHHVMVVVNIEQVKVVSVRQHPQKRGPQTRPVGSGR